MNYFIAVETPALGPVSDLVDALQQAYDMGTAGDFEVLVTQQPTYMVIFKRHAPEDAEYVSDRVKADRTSVAVAAMQQLAAEMEDGASSGLATIMAVLKAGDAQYFDFGQLVFSSIAPTAT